MPSRHAHVVLGPGAIGGAVAGALVQAGHSPVLAARSPLSHLAVTTPDAPIESAVRSFTDPAQVGPADLLFVAVKAHHSPTVRDWLDALVDASTVVVILQNGVEHLDRFTPLVHPDASLVPAVVALPAQRRAPGRVEVGGVRSSRSRPARAPKRWSPRSMVRSSRSSPPMIG